MRTNKIFLLIAISLVIVIISCKKYSDGPSFSPWPKKWRLVNTWKVDSYVINGNSQSVSEDTSYQIKGNGDFNIIYGTNLINEKWVWEDKKGTMKISNDSNTRVIKEVKVLRLTSSEFWTTDKNGGVIETHYVHTK